MADAVAPLLHAVVRGQRLNKLGWNVAQLANSGVNDAVRTATTTRVQSRRSPPQPACPIRQPRYRVCRVSARRVPATLAPALGLFHSPRARSRRRLVRRSPVLISPHRGRRNIGSPAAMALLPPSRGRSSWGTPGRISVQSLGAQPGVPVDRLRSCAGRQGRRDAGTRCARSPRLSELSGSSGLSIVRG